MKNNYQKESLAIKNLDRLLIRRLLSYLFPFKKWVLLAIFFLLISKIIEAYIPFYIGQVTQKILTSDSLSISEKNLEMNGVIQNTLWMLSLIVLGSSLEIVNVYLKSWVGQKAVYNLRNQVYNHILRLPQSFYDHTFVGRLMTRTIHDVDQIDQMFTESLIPLFGNLFLFICMGVAIWVLDWRIALLATLFLPVTGYVFYNFYTHQRKCYGLIRSIVSSMNTFIQEHLTGISIIRSFGLEKKEKRKFEEQNVDLCNSYLQSIENFGFFISSIDFLSALSIILTFIILVIFSTSSDFKIGTYFTFTLYSAMFFRPLFDLAERYNVLQSALAASERIFDILDQKEESLGITRELLLKDIKTILFEDVWFAYEEENWILKGFNLKIDKGESIALVGLTGAGKTSILNLLLRLYEFQKGAIKINGRDIREYSVESLRRNFSVIFQDPVLFSGTLEDNISLYDSTIPHEKIESSINFVNLRPIVDRYEKGIKHFILERGKSLSAGERQLISFARAVAHDRSVLIFDEATANIDTGTERIIQDALKKILKNKTSIVIAHRLSTIKDVTKILVIHEGVAVEIGTHQELLKREGLYEKLYRLQFMVI